MGASQEVCPGRQFSVGCTEEPVTHRTAGSGKDVRSSGEHRGAGWRVEMVRAFDSQGAWAFVLGKRECVAASRWRADGRDREVRGLAGLGPGWPQAARGRENRVSKPSQDMLMAAPTSSKAMNGRDGLTPTQSLHPPVLQEGVGVTQKRTCSPASHVPSVSGCSDMY